MTCKQTHFFFDYYSPCKTPELMYRMTGILLENTGNRQNEQNRQFYTNFISLSVSLSVSLNKCLECLESNLFGKFMHSLRARFCKTDILSSWVECP